VAADIERLIAAVRDDRAHGATELARRAAAALIAAAGSPLSPLTQELQAAQPAMAPVWNLCQTVLAAEAGGRGAVIAACHDFVSRMNRAGAAIARRAAELIPEGGVVLTHSCSEAVYESLRRARESNRVFRVIATESRPLCEGQELAARLRSADVDARVVIDAAMAVAGEEADVIFVGADSVSPSFVVNKVGTRLLALVGQAAGKPAYVLCPSMKLWDREAPPVEGFEATPRALFRAILTEAGAV
jgi:translation initiation factor 2B subunit (eIF-2B alpha/beta/delta family)